jgi:hypothetical protein
VSAYIGVWLLEIDSFSRTNNSVGVMMIPIPKSGIFRNWSGEEAASAVPGVTGVEITAKLHYPIAALPEGSSYLGFIFANGNSPEFVEAALRQAHQELTFNIADLIPMAVT